MSTAKKYFSGNGNGNVLEKKSSSTKTCNLLSSFLKETGNLTDLRINSNFDALEKPTTTVDLLSSMESPIEKSTKTEESTSRLPQYVSLDSFLKSEDFTNKARSSNPVTKTESKTEQMTIFYKGQVLVFDNVSADKARDLMLAAIRASPKNQTQNRVQLASTSNSSCESFGSQHILPGNGWDLPIARRVSLHKFLEKRKERATVSAPYQLHNPSSNNKFDLNL